MLSSLVSSLLVSTLKTKFFMVVQVPNECLCVDLDEVSNIAVQVLEQKALGQQDPDQNENEEPLEDSAEYDSVLISSVGDLVAALATTLGADFSPAFNTFYPLVTRYYVCIKLFFLLVFIDSPYSSEKESFSERPLGCDWLPSGNHQWNEAICHSFH